MDYDTATPEATGILMGTIITAIMCIRDMDTTEKGSIILKSN